MQLLVGATVFHAQTDTHFSVSGHVGANIFEHVEGGFEDYDPEEKEEAVFLYRINGMMQLEEDDAEEDDETEPLGDLLDVTVDGTCKVKRNRKGDFLSEAYDVEVTVTPCNAEFTVVSKNICVGVPDLDDWEDED